jgi:erythromycin esterase
LIEERKQKFRVRKLVIITGLVIALPFFLSTAQAQTPPVPINGATDLEASLKPGVSHEYALRLARGESAVVVVKQQGVDVIVNLMSPAGKLLDSIDSPNGRNGDEVVEIIAQESGVYRIVVLPFDANEPAGSYRLGVKALRGTDETTQLLRTRRESRQEAVRWLRPYSAAIPLSGVLPENVKVAPLDQIAARVKVLGLGEATHGSREFGDLRFSITRYLVERHRYRVIAIEASANTLELLTPYVNNESERTPAMTRLIESGWIGRRTRRELYEWVRGWNKEHPRDRVRIIGVDAQENLSSRETLRAFLGRAYGEELLKRWATAEADLAAADEQTAVFGDSGVEAATRQLLLEIVAMLDLDAPLLRNKFGEPALERAMDAARTLAEFADFNSGSPGAINHSRDWYMAVRVLRALQESGASAKALYWAHNAHVTHPPNSNRSAGALLRSTLGCEYGALAITFGEGAFVAQIPNDLEDRLAVSALPPAPDESIESVLAELNAEGALATWPCSTERNRSTKIESIPEWLRKAHLMHWVGGLYTPGSVNSAAFRPFDLLNDFDGVVFLRRVTADEIPTDRPLIPARKRRASILMSNELTALAYNWKVRDEMR